LSAVETLENVVFRLVPSAANGNAGGQQSVLDGRCAFVVGQEFPK
jgi:hypothetical protein